MNPHAALGARCHSMHHMPFPQCCAPALLWQHSNYISMCNISTWVPSAVLIWCLLFGCESSEIFNSLIGTIQFRGASQRSSASSYNMHLIAIYLNVTSAVQWIASMPVFLRLRMMWSAMIKPLLILRVMHPSWLPRKTSREEQNQW